MFKISKRNNHYCDSCYSEIKDVVHTIKKPKTKKFLLSTINLIILFLICLILIVFVPTYLFFWSTCRILLVVFYKILKKEKWKVCFKEVWESIN